MKCTMHVNGNFKLYSMTNLPDVPFVRISPKWSAPQLNNKIIRKDGI